MTPLRTALQRILVPLLLASLLAAQGEGKLRVGTWNLEFFGGPASMRSFTEPGKERREVPARRRARHAWPSLPVVNPR